MSKAGRPGCCAHFRDLLNWCVPVPFFPLLLVFFAAAFCAALAQQQSAPAVNESAEAHVGKAYDALKEERYKVAVSEFRAALQLDPKLVTRARFPLAVALFEMHEWTEARREFEAVRSETGDHPNVLYYLGRLDLMEQNFERAIRNLTQAVAKPPFPDTAYYLGLACFKQGDFAAAEKWLKLALQTNPRDSLAAFQLALVYRKDHRDRDADAMFTRSAELRREQSEESRQKLECGQALAQQPREAARVVCQRLYDSNDAEKLTALGTMYGQHGDLEAALEPLQRAAELAPQSPQMQYNLAYTYYRMNRFAEARRPIAAAVERWPDLFQLNALYGAVLLKLNELLPAYQALHRAHELNQQDAATADLLYSAVLALARKSQAARDYSDSLRYFDEATKLRPQDPEPLRGIAEVNALTGRSKAP